MEAMGGGLTWGAVWCASERFIADPKLGLEVFDLIGQSRGMNSVAAESGTRMKGQTVTRADLCESVHEEVGLTRQDCSELVERVLELVAQALERGEQVKLSGFGVFQVRARTPGWGATPRRGSLRPSIPPSDRLRGLPGDEARFDPRLRHVRMAR